MWTERHRPKSLAGIRGQDAAVAAIRQWANSWLKGRPKHKAVLFHGPAGTGKTAAALALGVDMGWEVLEINASDTRSQLSLRELIKSSRTRYSLLSGPGLRLYVIDEVDGLSGAEDRGGVRAIAQMITESVNPIVLICNDLYSSKLRYLRRIARTIKFVKPRKAIVQNVLQDICRREGIEVDLLALNLLAERADGDLRAAINDLQAISMKGRVSREDLRVPDKRKVDTHIYALLDLIFEGDPDSARQARELNLRPDQLLDWIAQNAPLKFSKKEDRTRAYEMISTADIYLSWVSRRMYWKFWGYATDLMTRGLGSLAEMSFPHYGPNLHYSYPRDYQRHKAMMATMHKASEGSEVSDELDVARIIGDRCHMSTKDVFKDFLPYLRIIQENDPEMAGAILRSVGVSQEDLCNLPFG